MPDAMTFPAKPSQILDTVVASLAPRAYVVAFELMFLPTIQAPASLPLKDNIPMDPIDFFNQPVDGDFSRAMRLLEGEAIVAGPSSYVPHQLMRMDDRAEHPPIDPLSLTKPGTCIHLYK